MGLKEELFEVLGPEFVFSGQNYSEKEAKCIIFGVPFDGTTCFKPGARFGPNSIREASINLETYSSIREKDFFQNAKTFDMGDLECMHAQTGQVMPKIEKTLRAVLGAGKVPVMLGGEHSITFGALKAFAGMKDFVLLQFDAHPDLEKGEYLTHGNFLRKALDFLDAGNVLQVGIRSQSKEQAEFAKSKKIKQYSAVGAGRGLENAKEAVKGFTAGKKVYVSIDLDVFDCGLVPGVGTPEPGGIGFDDALELAGAVEGKIVGLDVVECAPDAEKVTQTTAAKLLYEVLAGARF